MIPLDPVPRPLDHLALRGEPGAVALADRVGTITFAQLDEAVGALAAWLAARLSPGDRVASWLPKTRVACVLPLAAARAGLVHVPVNPALRRAQEAQVHSMSPRPTLVSWPKTPISPCPWPPSRP